MHVRPYMNMMHFMHTKLYVHRRPFVRIGPYMRTRPFMHERLYMHLLRYMHMDRFVHTKLYAIILLLKLLSSNAPRQTHKRLSANMRILWPATKLLVLLYMLLAATNTKLK